MPRTCMQGEYASTLPETLSPCNKKKKKDSKDAKDSPACNNKYHIGAPKRSTHVIKMSQNAIVTLKMP